LGSNPPEAGKSAIGGQTKTINEKSEIRPARRTAGKPSIPPPRHPATKTAGKKDGGQAR